MRIEGKVREQNKGIYEIAFNAPFRSYLPRRSGDGAPLVMKIAGDEFPVRIFKAKSSEYTWVSSNIGRKDKKLYDVLREHGFKVRDTICFDFHRESGALETLLAPPNQYERADLDETVRYIEGVRRRVEQSMYERDPRAKALCLKLHGVSCAVCGVNLQEHYELEKPIIEVHHLIPLSQLKGGYEVDPGKDMRPVCPNCHAVIHSRQPPFDIKEVKVMLHKKNVSAQERG